MGATTFGDYQAGTDAEEAFRAAQEEARYDYGHSGYTGTIAEKDGFTIISKEPVTRDEARRMGNELINENDPRVIDKWGPAGAIAVKTCGKRIVEVTIPDKATGYESLEEAALAGLAAGGDLREGEKFAEVITGNFFFDCWAKRFTRGSLTVRLEGSVEEFSGWWFFGWASC